MFLLFQVGRHCVCHFLSFQFWVVILLVIVFSLLLFISILGCRFVCHVLSCWENRFSIVFVTFCRKYHTFLQNDPKNDKRTTKKMTKRQENANFAISKMCHVACVFLSFFFSFLWNVIEFPKNTVEIS